MRRSWTVLAIVVVLMVAGQTARAVDEYKTASVVHTEGEGFTTVSSYDEATETHYLRVINGKAGAIFSWPNSEPPEITQESVSGNLHLIVKRPAGIGNCCIIAYIKWPSDWDFRCEDGCASCGCMLCFGCLSSSTDSIEFGPSF